MKEWKEYVFEFRKVLIDDKVSEATYDSKGMEDRMEIVTWFGRRGLFLTKVSESSGVLSYP